MTYNVNGEFRLTRELDESMGSDDFIDFLIEMDRVNGRDSAIGDVVPGRPVRSVGEV